MGPTRALFMLFGATSTPAESFIKFGRKLIVMILEKEPMAQANLPSRKEVHRFQAVVALRHPALRVFGRVPTG